MIAIIIVIAPLFFVYRRFAETAFEHEKNRGLFGVTGAGIYIGAFLLFYFITGLLASPMIAQEVQDTAGTMNSKRAVYGWVVVFSSIGLASLATFIAYRLIIKSWKKDDFRH